MATLDDQLFRAKRLSFVNFKQTESVESLVLIDLWYVRPGSFLVISFLVEQCPGAI